MTLLRSSQEDLVALAGEAADALGIPEPSFVEKDYWVVELLRSVMRPLELEPIDGRACSARALFKGGTSLSKGLVNRPGRTVSFVRSASEPGSTSGCPMTTLR